MQAWLIWDVSLPWNFGVATASYSGCCDADLIFCFVLLGESLYHSKTSRPVLLLLSWSLQSDVQSSVQSTCSQSLTLPPTVKYWISTFLAHAMPPKEQILWEGNSTTWKTGNPLFKFWFRFPLNKELPDHQFSQLPNHCRSYLSQSNKPIQVWRV